ncbi:MAG: hypothetical protein N3B10_09980 [Armatimonadetes bacterium]|nr:hypothetical protein [Armatimonadota bacterium]
MASELVERFGKWLGGLLVRRLPNFAKGLGQALYEQEVLLLRECAITFMLECLRREIVAVSENLTLSELRTNLMLWQPNKTLRITYASGDYSAAEKQLEWREGIGCCGMAWAQKETTVTDMEDTKRLPSPYKEVVSHVQSVLSVPVRSRITNDWIGVLNVDSFKPLLHSHLGEPKVRDIAIRYALGIGLLF